MLKITKEQLLELIEKVFELGGDGCLCWDSGEPEFENKKKNLETLIAKTFLLLENNDQQS